MPEKQLTKYDLITIITRVLDDNERMAREIKALEEVKSTDGRPEKPATTMDDINRLVTIKGLESLVEYNSCFEYPELVRADTKTRLSREEWISRVKISEYSSGYGRLPGIIVDNLSRKEVLNLFKPYFEYKYFKAVKEQDEIDEASKEAELKSGEVN